MAESRLPEGFEDPAPPWQEVLGEVESHLSSWREARHDAGQGAEEALELLTAWTRLRRFPPAKVEGDLFHHLDRVVRAEAEQLVERALSEPFLTCWEADANQVDEGWEAARDAQAAKDLEEHTRELFHRLDQYSLVVPAGRVLLPAGHRLWEKLEALAEEVEKAEALLAEKPDLFLAAAGLAAEELRFCRHDLEEFDEPLWETTLKHARLEELLAEQEAKPLLPPLAPEDVWDLLALPQAVVSDYGRALQRADEPQLAMSAETARETDLDAVRAELAAASALVEGEPRLKVGLDFLLSSQRRPVGLQVRLRGPDEVRRLYVKAAVALAGPGTEAEVIELSAGRGALPVAESALLRVRPALASGMRIELQDAAGTCRPVHLE
jgi:hypothetical protein